MPPMNFSNVYALDIKYLKYEIRIEFMESSLFLQRIFFINLFVNFQK